jgi:hypothetical protein
MDEKQTKRMVLTIVSIVLAIAAIITIIPAGSVEKASLLGYKAICPFTPISTFICAFGSRTAYVLGKKSVKS